MWGMWHALFSSSRFPVLVSMLKTQRISAAKGPAWAFTKQLINRSLLLLLNRSFSNSYVKFCWKPANPLLPLCDDLSIETEDVCLDIFIETRPCPSIPMCCPVTCLSEGMDQFRCRRSQGDTLVAWTAGESCNAGTTLQHATFMVGFSTINTLKHLKKCEHLVYDTLFLQSL